MRISARLLVFVLAAAGLSAPAQAEELIVLDCAGVLTHSDRMPGPHTEPWKGRITIDLAHKTFCVDHCTRPQPLLESSEAGATLTDMKASGYVSTVRWVPGDAHYTALGRLGGDPIASITSTCRLIRRSEV